MTSGAGPRPNRLILEKSPYLLQHARNPVDWYPWGPEAFKKAEEDDKPVFLSIGYSTCHWCHVMEKESFEDPEVARLLNDAFVCIKVDREERPDLDVAYMKVCQALIGTGGWPLHIIMTHDKKPFFAATYIPREKRFGYVGMKELISSIKKLWVSHRNELIKSGDEMLALLRQTEKARRVEPSEELREATLDEAYLQLAENFDYYNGGFRQAPKFPSPHNLMFLLRYWKRTGDQKALQMVEKTLNAMRLGGIYDHLGFGFHRYSTDAQWLVPHFEKMLYDQAMLTMAYTEAYLATNKGEYKQTAEGVIVYVLQKMTNSQGGFYSAEDADSEGEEGKYYLWTEEQIRQLLSKEEANLAKKVFNIEADGNFKETTTGEKTGKNILHSKKSVVDIEYDIQISPESLQKIINDVRQKLLQAREKRLHPNKDDKILTDWNGLMIAAFAKAAQAFNEPKYAIAATKAADFIISKMIDNDGKILHRYRDGEAAISGFLDDYAFLIWGLLELYEATFSPRYLRKAIELTERMIAHFWDTEQGGFYQTADYSDTALDRNKEIYDGAYPSGNSVAAMDLIRLARMTGEMRFEDKAAELRHVFQVELSKTPSAHAYFMVALDFALGPSSEVVIVGNPEKEDTTKMLRALQSRFLPRKVVLFRSSVENDPEIAHLARFTKELSTKNGIATAYVCRNHICNLPTTEVKTMLEQLEK